MEFILATTRLKYARESNLKLRSALAELIGASTRSELEEMKSVICAMDDIENKEVALKALTALIETAID